MKKIFFLTVIVIFLGILFVSAEQQSFCLNGECTLYEDDVPDYGLTGVVIDDLTGSEIYAQFVTLDSVVLYVNGESTGRLWGGEQKTLSDGISIFILEIISPPDYGEEMKRIVKLKIEYNECEEKGYFCREFCISGLEEIVPEYSCPKFSARPVVCCAQIDLPESDLGIRLNKETFFSGDRIEINYASNDNLDCAISIVSSEEEIFGITEQSGSFSRVGSVEFELFSRLKSFMGEKDITGEYSILIDCLNEDGEQVVLTKTFQIVDETRESYICNLDTNPGKCVFQNVEYEILFIFSEIDEHDLIKFEISYGELTEEGSVRRWSEDTFVLSNGVILTNIDKAVASPHSTITFITIKPAEPSCQGCVLEEVCYSFNFRKDGNYCAISGEWVPQLDDEEACENHFECKSNLCISGECIEGNLVQKIIAWFRNFFRR